MHRCSKTLCVMTAYLILVGVHHASSREPNATDFVSEASRLVGSYKPTSRDHSTQAMANAANAFLESLDDSLRQRAKLALDHPERREWTNLPARTDAGGVRLGECNARQLKAFCELLGNLFSEQGYAKMCNIMLADDQLLKGRSRPGFGTENFSVVIFGEPSPNGP